MDKTAGMRRVSYMGAMLLTEEVLPIADQTPDDFYMGQE